MAKPFGHVSGVEMTEMPDGFSVNYNNRQGLRGYNLPHLRLWDPRSPEEIKELLYRAYLTLCKGVQPRGPLGDVTARPPTPIENAKIDRAIRQAMAAERGAASGTGEDPPPPEAA